MLLTVFSLPTKSSVFRIGAHWAIIAATGGTHAIYFGGFDVGDGRRVRAIMGAAECADSSV